MMVSFVLSFFPRDVLDEILNLIESVSEDFPSYSMIVPTSSYIYLVSWAWTLVCFLEHRGPSGGLLPLKCFNGFADAPENIRCLNALSLLSPHPCFSTIFPLILTVARDDTLMS